MSRPKTPGTCIEDLSAVGYELSEEHLQLVAGGARIVTRTGTHDEIDQICTEDYFDDSN